MSKKIAVLAVQGAFIEHERALAKLGCECVELRQGPDVEQPYDALVLPGVGAFQDGMQGLEQLGLIEPIKQKTAQGTPLLGICLGMQMLFDESEEFGLHKGLGLIPGEVCPLADDLKDPSLKVPHIGWNSLHLVRPENPLMANTREGDFVYFVHSFYAKGCGDALVAGAEYGVTVPGAVARGNVYGCQFHPEKSGALGLKLLENFAVMTRGKGGV